MYTQHLANINSGIDGALLFYDQIKTFVNIKVQSCEAYSEVE